MSEVGYDGACGHTLSPHPYGCAASFAKVGCALVGVGGTSMANNAVTRADLADALHQNLGLARSECAQLLEDVLNEISDCLARGEPVKLTGFGSFLVRHKKERMGRNPKTGEAVPISPRKVILFRPSQNLKQRINHT